MEPDHIPSLAFPAAVVQALLPSGLTAETFGGSALHRATVLHLDQDLLPRAGLPGPAGDPLAHASPGVAVRIGPWHW